MQKNTLERFIQKYNLSGNVNSVKIKCKDQVLSTSFMTDGKNLLGEVVVKDVDLDNCLVGVYSTDQLMKLLNVLGDDITLDVVKVNEKAVSLKINDGSVSVNFVLADMAIIADTPPMKNIPEFETEINIDYNFINRFIRAKGALSEEDTFTVVKRSNDINFIIGYSSINTNRITIPVNVTTSGGSNDNIVFDANLFRDILVANKECSSGTLKLSSDGLIKVEFNIDNYSAIYYLVARTT